MDTRSHEYTWFPITQTPAYSDLADGAKQHALGFSTLKDVQRVDAALTAPKDCRTDPKVDPSSPQSVITVVGAGYAGVELAATVAERMKGIATVHLMSPTGENFCRFDSMSVCTSRAGCLPLGSH